MSANKVSTQFTVRLLPIAQRFRRSWQSGSQSKGVQQPVGRQCFEITTIGLGSRAERAGAEPHLFRREGSSGKGYSLTNGLFRHGGGSLIRGFLRRGKHGPGSKDGCAGASRNGNKVAATEGYQRAPRGFRVSAL